VKNVATSQRGFDHSYGPLFRQIDHFKHESHGVTDWYRDNKLVKEPRYDTVVLPERWFEFIDANGGGPGVRLRKRQQRNG
jgi:hypothetical protein